MCNTHNKFELVFIFYLCSAPSQAYSPAHSSTPSTPSRSKHSTPPHTASSLPTPPLTTPSHTAKRPEPLVFSSEPLPPSFFTSGEDFIDWVDPEVAGGGDRTSQSSFPSSNGTPKNSPYSRRKRKDKKMHQNGIFSVCMPC